MQILGRHIGLFCIGAYALLGAITAWADDPIDDTPPIMAFMMMAIGFVFLAVYVLVRVMDSGSQRGELARGFQVLPLIPPDDG